MVGGLPASTSSAQTMTSAIAIASFFKRIHTSLISGVNRVNCGSDCAVAAACTYQSIESDCVTLELPALSCCAASTSAPSRLDIARRNTYAPGPHHTPDSAKRPGLRKFFHRDDSLNGQGMGGEDLDNLGSNLRRDLIFLLPECREVDGRCQLPAHRELYDPLQRWLQLVDKQHSGTVAGVLCSPAPERMEEGQPECQGEKSMPAHMPGCMVGHLMAENHCHLVVVTRFEGRVDQVGIEDNVTPANHLGRERIHQSALDYIHLGQLLELKALGEVACVLMNRRVLVLRDPDSVASYAGHGENLRQPTHHQKQSRIKQNHQPCLRRQNQHHHEGRQGQKRTHKQNTKGTFLAGIPDRIDVQCRPIHGTSSVLNRNFNSG